MRDTLVSRYLFHGLPSPPVGLLGHEHPHSGKSTNSALPLQAIKFLFRFPRGSPGLCVSILASLSWPLLSLAYSARFSSGPFGGHKSSVHLTSEQFQFTCTWKSKNRFLPCGPHMCLWLYLQAPLATSSHPLTPLISRRQPFRDYQGILQPLLPSLLPCPQALSCLLGQPKCCHVNSSCSSSKLCERRFSFFFVSLCMWFTGVNPLHLSAYERMKNSNFLTVAKPFLGVWFRRQRQKKEDLSQWLTDSRSWFSIFV